MFKGFLKNDKLNSKIKLLNNLSSVILIFAILKFRKIVLHFVVLKFDPHPKRDIEYRRYVGRDLFFFYSDWRKRALWLDKKVATLQKNEEKKEWEKETTTTTTKSRFNGRRPLHIRESIYLVISARLHHARCFTRFLPWALFLLLVRLLSRPWGLVWSRGRLEGGWRNVFLLNPCANVDDRRGAASSVRKERKQGKECAFCLRLTLGSWCRAIGKERM